MNNDDNISDLDEDQLEEELKNINCDRQSLFNDQSLFGDSNLDQKIDQTAPIKQFLGAPASEKNAQLVADFTKPAQSQQVKKKPPIHRPKQKNSKSPLKKQVARKRQNHSVSVITRNTEWIEEKKQKLLEGQRQKHRNQTKECSFKPRLNCSVNSSRQYNNISNISSLSIIRSKPIEINNVSNIQTAPNTRPLIQKWRQEVNTQALIIRNRLQGKQGKQNVAPRYFNRPMYQQSRMGRDIRTNKIIDTNRESPQFTQRTQQQPPTRREYLALVQQADELFSQLKYLKQANWKLLRQIQQPFQL